MYKLFAPLVIILALSLSIVRADEYNMSEVMRAVVRVESERTYGSGTVFSESKSGYYILTNAHVVGDSNNVDIDFFILGKHHKRVKGKVTWKHLDERRSIDLAIVTVLKSNLGDHKPLVIKLAPRDVDVNVGDTIFSMGFPHARWAMGWFGRVIKDSRIMHFHPTPFAGQSGSSILIREKGETYIIAILGWKTWEDRVKTTGKLGGYGVAMRVSVLYDLIGDPNESDPTGRKIRRTSIPLGDKYWRNSKGFNLPKEVRIST